MLEGKLTLPVLYALNTTKDEWAEQTALKVKEGTATPDEIVRLIQFTKENGGIEYACRIIEQYKRKHLICWLLCLNPISVWPSGLIWTMWSTVRNNYSLLFLRRE